MEKTPPCAPRCRIPRLLGFVLVSLGVACSAPQYDDQTDKLITTLQTDIDSELVMLISLGQQMDLLKNKTDSASKAALTAAQAKASYDGNTAAYDKIRVDLISVQMRIDAAPNPSTAKLDGALQFLVANLFGDKSLEATHQQQNFLGVNYLKNEEIILNQQLQALLTYELVLKGGGPAASSK